MLCTRQRSAFTTQTPFMTTAAYWGAVAPDWAGFSSDITFSNPFFESQNVAVFLGEDEDEEEAIPTEAQLLEFAATYQAFLKNIETHLESLQQKAFDRYGELYAHYYEHPEQSGAPALGIDSVSRHNATVKDLMYLRVLDSQTIKMTIRYELDTEHGLEFRFEDGQLKAVGGIAET